MRTKFVSFLSAGVLLMLFLVVLALGKSHSQGSPTSTGSGGQLSATPASSDQHLAHLGLVIPHAAGTMLTQQQVYQYVDTHNFWIGPTVSGKMFTIQKVQLMTAQQAYKVEEVDSLGVPDNEPVYYVVAYGPFKIVDLLSPHPNNLTVTAWGYEVWDAKSGNLLGVGM